MYAAAETKNPSYRGVVLAPGSMSTYAILIQVQVDGPLKNRD